jgi:hypothetical protein
VTRLAAVFALSALAAASVGMAQQQPPTEPPTTPSQQPTTPPPDTPAPSPTGPQSDPSADRAQALMQDCLQQIQAANPNASQQDVQAYCEKQVGPPSSSETPQTPQTPQ